MRKPISSKQKIRRAETARIWRKKNPEKSAAISKRTRAKNKDKILKRQRRWLEDNKNRHIESAKTWYQNNKERVRNLRLLREFGITASQYDDMFLLQKGLCSICGGGPDARNKSLAVDHDHKTGKIRSLLCRGCNVGIGNLKDDPDLLNKAADYIRKHNGKTIDITKL